ncbi:MAG: Na+/H+ antiporter subunit E, partial [Arenicellales bacterium]
MRNTLTLLLMLSGTWFLLSGHTSPLLLSLGLVSVVTITACISRLEVLDDEGMPVRLLPGLLRYAPWLAGQVIRSNLDVARRIINPKLPISPSV